MSRTISLKSMGLTVNSVMAVPKDLLASDTVPLGVDSRTQISPNKRGLTMKRLKALTVLHNYFIRRTDGTTAAERLFGEKPPDLIEWMLEQMGDLPIPRLPRKRGESNQLDLHFVPA